MTSGERLRSLAGVGGSAAALLLLIGTGATAGEALRDYSGLASATAVGHLLADVGIPPEEPTYTQGGAPITRRKQQPSKILRARMVRDNDILFLH